ncbi:MAG: copper chaperone PCu(A)C [Sphingomonadales bacterium]|nr:copper chaperone PCu(A)C [Sphingomonadales bacterium]
MKTARLLAPFAVLLAVSACNQESKSGAASDAASGPVEAKPGVKLADGRLVLPAVKGNPAAAYFTLDNSGKGTVSLAAVSVAGAQKAEMHQTTGDTMASIDRADVDPGTVLRFEPGKMHVMVFGLDSKVAAGSSVELTLTFADGDKLSAPLKVEAAGGGMDAMGSMDHGAKH